VKFFLLVLSLSLSLQAPCQNPEIPIDQRARPHFRKAIGSEKEKKRENASGGEKKTKK
jgi:hypothetical protein